MTSKEKGSRKREILTDDQCYVLDILTISRTHMSNERTLLAYINSFLAMVATGVGLIKFTNDNAYVNLGFVLLCLSVIILIIGVCRFIRLRKLIKNKVCVNADCNSKMEAYDSGDD